MCYYGPSSTNLTMYGSALNEGNCSLSCQGNDFYTNNFGPLCGGAVANSIYIVQVIFYLMCINNRLYHTL